MIRFEEAIKKARESAQSLIENAKNISLEGVLLSGDKKLYEVTLSYDLTGRDPLGIQQDEGIINNNLLNLAKIMSYRREYKVFLVDRKSGEFRGFRSQKGG